MLLFAPEACSVVFPLHILSVDPHFERCPACIVDFPRPYSCDKEVYDCPISCLQHISSFFSIDTTFLLRFVMGIPATSEASDELDAIFIIFTC